MHPHPATQTSFTHRWLQVVVFGTKGDTGLQELEASSSDFERNKLDCFFLSGPDIGEITDLKVGTKAGQHG